MPEMKLGPVRTDAGSLVRLSATVEFRDGRIIFVKSHYKLKDEIKAMRGSHWHQFDEEGLLAGKKIWSADDCQRNRFQLGYLAGEDVYAWFDRPVARHQYREYFRNGVPAEPMPQQFDMADAGLTYHYQILAAEMGTGKTLAAQMVIENSGVDLVWWVGPKTSLPNIQREFRLWGFPFDRIKMEWFTYEGLVRVMDEWDGSQTLPRFCVMDESSRCKTATSQRSKACQKLADLIRDKYGYDGFVIEMSGTPSPKTPMDWWSQCEIAWPGFLKEGSRQAMETRLAFMVDQQFDDGGKFKKRIGWKDDEHKCDKCGKLSDEGPHDECADPDEYHAFVPSINEVAYLYERLRGLVIIKHKKDCLSLPEKRYRRIICKPTASALRVAEAIVRSAPNAVTGMTLLRELSDGFQYHEVRDGTAKCTYCTDGSVERWRDPDEPERNYPGTELLPAEVVARLVKETIPCPLCGGKQEVPRMVRVAREVPCPKDAALKMLLDENEETGRIVIWAGFTGSIDRIVRLCLAEHWDVVRCDGGAYQVLTQDGVSVSTPPLDYWGDLASNARVAFVSNPESGGMSLTLVEARMAVYWSNSWKPEYRVQSEDRIHRKGMDENLGCTIVDLIHLPSDRRVLHVIRDNRRLELMTMGEVMEGVNWQDGGQEGDMRVEETAS